MSFWVAVLGWVLALGVLVGLLALQRHYRRVERETCARFADAVVAFLRDARLDATPHATPHAWSARDAGAGGVVVVRGATGRVADVVISPFWLAQGQLPVVTTEPGADEPEGGRIRPENLRELAEWLAGTGPLPAMTPGTRG